MPSSKCLDAVSVRDCVVMIDVGRLYTEGGRIPEQVSLGWVRELAKYETVTKQETIIVHGFCLFLKLEFLS